MSRKRVSFFNQSSHVYFEYQYHLNIHFHADERMNHNSSSQFYLMEKGEKPNPFGHQPRNKKSIQTSQTLNDSLPTLQAGKGEKANVLRNQLTDTRSQIVLLEAKLRNLRHLKDRNDLNNQRNITRIEFMNGVKQRIRNDQQHKQKLRQARAESLETLRHEVEARREALVSERKNAEQQLLTIKVNDAEEERKKHKEHQYLIHKLKEIDAMEKVKKVERVKEFHETSASRLKDFQDSRIAFSKDNYQQKVSSTLQEKERARTVLEQLRLEEERLLRDVKNSEQAMLTSLYSLETINPQHRKRFKSDRSKHREKPGKDEDYYSHEQFDP